MTSADLDLVFSALAHPTRRGILAALQNEPAPVHAIAALFEVSRPAISKHLAVLRDAGLVHETQIGRENVYEFDRQALHSAHAWLTAFWRGRLDALKRLVEDR